MSVLEVENLRVTFRQDGRLIEAVKGVSFTVDKGETVALVGESGSGKSVTALSTVGLLADTAAVTGSVTYSGTQMIGASKRALRRVRGNDISFIFICQHATRVKRPRDCLYVVRFSDGFSRGIPIILKRGFIIQVNRNAVNPECNESH